MECDECRHLETIFLESMVLADRAQTELRCYFVMHRGSCCVSDFAEYESLSGEERRTTGARQHAYIELVNHRRCHSQPALQSMTESFDQ